MVFWLKKKKPEFLTILVENNTWSYAIQIRSISFSTFGTLDFKISHANPFDKKPNKRAIKYLSNHESSGDEFFFFLFGCCCISSKLQMK